MYSTALWLQVLLSSFFFHHHIKNFKFHLIYEGFSILQDVYSWIKLNACRMKKKITLIANRQKFKTRRLPYFISAIFLLLYYYYYYFLNQDIFRERERETEKAIIR